MFSSSAGQGGRPWVLRLTLAAFGLSLLTGLVLWQWLESSSLAAVRGNVDALKPVFTVFRVLLIGLVAFFWPQLVTWFSKGQQSEESIRERRLALRWRILTWLVILELVLGQNLASRFVELLQVPNA